MNGHAASIHSLRHEESVTQLEEKSLSDMESDAGRADLESLFLATSNTNTRIPPFRKRLRFKLNATWKLSLGNNLRPAQILSRIAIFLLPSFLQSRFITTNEQHLSSLKQQQHQNNFSKRPSPTSYLDGMRGLAALIVFFCHYFYTCFVIAQSYGYGTSNYHFLKLPIIRLFYQGPPMVAVFFVISGYALSLKPLKLIRSRGARSYDSLLTTISSLIFRRGFRLFLPTFISTLLIMFLLRIGLYEWTREFAYDDVYMRNVQEIHYTRFNSTQEQMSDWAREMFRFVHIWDWDVYEGSTAIDVHLWTIPVEFRASMMLFLTILGTARLRTAWRFGFVGLVMGFVYRSARWEMVLFFAGMVLAEVDLVRGVHCPLLTPPTPAPAREEGAYQRGVFGGLGERETEMDGETVTGSESEGSSTACSSREGSLGLDRDGEVEAVLFDHDDAEKITTAARKRRPIRIRLRPVLVKASWIMLSILAMYLMSQPDQGGEETPGWVTLTKLIPKWWYNPTKQQHLYQQLDSCSTSTLSPKNQTDEEVELGQGQPQYRYYQSLGAILMVLSASRSPFWQGIFNSCTIQYLGKISYAIYLMHGPVLHTVGYAIERFVWVNITGVETDIAYIAGFCIASLAIIPIVVWVSDVFWRAVDEPVVRFGKWLEGVCSVSVSTGME